MANNIAQLDVDVKRKVSSISGGTQIHVKTVSTGKTERIAQIDQGGVIELDYPVYDGPYEATPTTEDQVFATKETSMTDDFTVKATPYSEVSNPEGGYTATIL